MDPVLLQALNDNITNNGPRQLMNPSWMKNIPFAERMRNNTNFGPNQALFNPTSPISQQDIMNALLKGAPEHLRSIPNPQFFATANDSMALHPAQVQEMQLKLVAQEMARKEALRQQLQVITNPEHAIGASGLPGGSFKGPGNKITE